MAQKVVVYAHHFRKLLGLTARFAAAEKPPSRSDVASERSHAILNAKGVFLETPVEERIREFAGPDTPIHAAGPGGVARSFTLAELLPESFGPETLGE